MNSISEHRHRQELALAAHLGTKKASCLSAGRWYFGAAAVRLSAVLHLKDISPILAWLFPLLVPLAEGRTLLVVLFSEEKYWNCLV